MIGVNIVKASLEAPLKTIAFNAGKEGAVIANQVKAGDQHYGYNANTDKYEDLYAAGVIDPTKVTRLALENAASIASLFLTTDCMIVDEPADEKANASAPPMGGGMGGMM